jgi:hypothetical protein
MKLIFPDGLPQTLREKITPLYRAGRVLAMDITFQREDVKFAGVNGYREYHCGWLAIRNILNDLEDFTPFLEELKLNFSALGNEFNNFETSMVGRHGCGELSQLRHKLPALLTLSLELNGNEIGDRGLNMLTRLNHRTLKTLYLGLKNNNIGSESMENLIAMGTTDTHRHAPLEALYVELEDNHIGTPGAIWLCMFGQGRYGGVIHTLHLGLQNNGICDIGADMLKRNLLRQNFPGIPTDYQRFQGSLIDSPGLQVRIHPRPQVHGPGPRSHGPRSIPHHGPRSAVHGPRSAVTVHGPRGRPGPHG